MHFQNLWSFPSLNNWGPKPPIFKVFRWQLQDKFNGKYLRNETWCSQYRMSIGNCKGSPAKSLKLCQCCLCVWIITRVAEIAAAEHGNFNLACTGLLPNSWVHIKTKVTLTYITGFLLVIESIYLCKILMWSPNLHRMCISHEWQTRLTYFSRSVGLQSYFGSTVVPQIVTTADRVVIMHAKAYKPTLIAHWMPYQCHLLYWRKSTKPGMNRHLSIRGHRLLVRYCSTRTIIFRWTSWSMCCCHSGRTRNHDLCIT